MLTLGPRLHLERIRRGLSQTALARRTGIAQANLSNIERGKQDITVATFLQICLALGVRPSSILEAPGTSRPRRRLTRAWMEKIAASVVGHIQPSSEERELVLFLRKIMRLGRNRRISAKEVNISWASLRRQLTDGEIEALRQRVQDTLQRGAHAKKHR